MPLKVKFNGDIVDRLGAHQYLFEEIVREAIIRVGIAGWNHISASHREGLVALQGLRLLLTQISSVDAEELRELARLTKVVAEAASFQDADTYKPFIVRS